jgi:ubiquinone/menaquinone biosynthesis C-methylase UbiE
VTGVQTCALPIFMRQVGFGKVDYHNLTLGVVALHVGHRLD